MVAHGWVSNTSRHTVWLHANRPIHGRGRRHRRPIRTPFAIRYGCNFTFESICRKCFAFSKLILSDFFRERSQNQESLQGVAHRAAPPEACPLGFAAHGFPDGFYKSISVSFLKCGIGGARCTCISQNEAIAPRGVRAVCCHIRFQKR